MRKIIVAFMALVFALPLLGKLTTIPPELRETVLDTLKVDGSEVAVITMKNDEKIYIKFFPEDAPNTVKNFIMLTNLGFYDGLTFHRVIPNFVAQGGDPLGDGTGDAGYDLNAEFNKRPHLTGTMAMARAMDPNSAGCQFYICLAPQPSLDEQYTVFGQLINGMNVVNKIKIGDVMKSVLTEKMDYAKELEEPTAFTKESAIYQLPRPVKIILPDYPEDLQAKGIKGIIVLQILIDKEGTVAESRIANPLNSVLDSLTLQVAPSWTFTPAQIMEKPVIDWITCAVKFELIDSEKVRVSACGRALIR